MSAPSTLNGKPQRKQLTDQLDRLDGIIDALAEGLPGAVADASKEGARQAVKDAIIEIITNPELRALLAPLPVTGATTPATLPESKPTPASKSGLWSRLKEQINAVKEAVTGKVTKVKESIVGRCRHTHEAVAAVGTAAGERVPVKQISLVALGVGTVVAVVCYAMPHVMSATVSGISTAATAVAVQAACWLKRAANRFGFVS